LVASTEALPPALNRVEPTRRNAGAAGFAGIAAAQNMAATALSMNAARSTRLEDPPRRKEPAVSEPASAPAAATPESATAKPADIPRTLSA
jgi:hypothetical protein